MSVNSISPGGGIPIQARVTCPHCWSASPGSNSVGCRTSRFGRRSASRADYPKRFLPSRFNLQGAAIEAGLRLSWAGMSQVPLVGAVAFL